MDILNRVNRLIVYSTYMDVANGPAVVDQTGGRRTE